MRKPQSWAWALDANMPETAAIQPMRMGLFCAIAGMARPEATAHRAGDEVAASERGGVAVLVSGIAFPPGGLRSEGPLYDCGASWRQS